MTTCPQGYRVALVRRSSAATSRLFAYDAYL